MIVDTLYDKKCEDKQYKILIIEDSKGLNELINKALANSGHTVVSGFTLKEAKEQLIQYDPKTVNSLAKVEFVKIVLVYMGWELVCCEEV